MPQIIRVSRKREVPEAKPAIRVNSTLRVVKRAALEAKTQLPIPVEAAAFSSDEQVRESEIRRLQESWNIHSESWRDRQNRDLDDLSKFLGGK